MGKTVLITGTSSGIGRETALFFQKKGWNVVATQRNPENESELNKLENVLVIKLDVTKEETIKAGIKLTLEKFKDIDVVINNAGYAQTGAFEATTPEQVEKEFSTNVFGIMNVIREILPLFRKKKSGVIVNIASMGGHIAFPLYSLYHSTKWAVEGFSESLQHELRQFNIKVKIIEPGVISTPFYDQLNISKKEGLTEYDEYINKTLPGMNEEGKKGSSPKGVAKTIYEAATSDNWQLRYPTGKSAKLILTARKILPDSLFTKLVRVSTEKN